MGKTFLAEPRNVDMTVSVLWLARSAQPIAPVPRFQSKTVRDHTTRIKVRNQWRARHDRRPNFIPDRPDGDWLNRQLALSVSKAINQSPSKAPRSCVSAGLLLEQRQTSSLFKLADAKSRLQCSSTPPTPKMAGATQDSTLSFSIPIKLRPCRCVRVRAPV